LSIQGIRDIIVSVNNCKKKKGEIFAMRYFSRITMIICMIIATALIFTSCSPAQYTEVEQPKPSEAETEVSDAAAEKDAEAQDPAEQEKPTAGSIEAAADQPNTAAQPAKPDAAKDAEPKTAVASASSADVQPAQAASQPASRQIETVQPSSQPKQAALQPAAPILVVSKPATQPATSAAQQAAPKPAVKPSAPKPAKTSVNDIEKLLNNILTNKYSAAKRDPALDKKAAEAAAALCSGKDTDNLLADFKTQNHTELAMSLSQNLSINRINAMINKALRNEKDDITKYGAGLASANGKIAAFVLTINKPTPPTQSAVEPTAPAKKTISPAIAHDMEQKVFAEINKQRKAAGANALTLSQSSTQQARAYALKMMQVENYYPPATDTPWLRMDKGGSVASTVEQMLKSCQDAGTFVPKDPSKGVTIGGNSGDGNIKEHIPAQYPYPYLQSPEYKSVGVGVYYGTDAFGKDLYYIVFILNK
jgi:uncharacterized protein YkwD